MDEKRTTKDVGVIDACIKELASALVSACAERGFFLESFVVKPLEGGEPES
mgnify:CR=1 FL=1